MSFLYGIFHAAGPGHGKAVISSYMVANEETWRRGVVLSFASALLQALVAVVLVGIAAGVAERDRGDHETRGRCDRNRELLAHRPDRRAVAVGEGRVFLATLRTLHRPAAVGAAVTPAHACTITAITTTSTIMLTHHAHDHGHAHADHDHVITSTATATRTIMRTIIMITTTMPRPGGTRMRPEPEELAGPGGWKRGLSAIVAVGLRPCSGRDPRAGLCAGAGAVLGRRRLDLRHGARHRHHRRRHRDDRRRFAKSWAKRFADTRSGYGMLAMRGIEVGAALVIIGFGALLLTGYMVSERMVGI